MATSLRTSLETYLNKQVPAAPLAMIRVLFGLLMVISAVRFLLLGWVQEQFVRPIMHFPYPGFEWVVTLGSPGMYILFVVLILASAMVMVGLYYRIASVVVFLCFTYIELIDVTYYLNHYYFVSVCAFLFCILPANRYFSMDTMRKPELYSATVPAICVDIFKLQIGIVYSFAGIAKIQSDWLLKALPLKIWLPAHTDVPIIGWLFSLEYVPILFSWFGMLFDCTIVYFLLFKPTRVYAYITVVVFHTLTGVLFQIGVFPVVMILFTTVFFNASIHEKAIVVLRTLFRNKETVRIEPKGIAGALHPVVTTVLMVFVVVQLLVPLRYLLYTGNLLWREEGYRYSWRVMLVEKAGTATFTVIDRKTGSSGVVVNSEFLNAHQEKQMSFQPDMVLRFAHWLHDYYQGRGVADPIVYADVWVTMNGRPSKQLINPKVDLSRERFGFHQYTWITDAY